MFHDEPKLRTEIRLNPADYPKFGFDSVWCGIGSCFSENLLHLLADCGLTVSQNPTGIIYNAWSIRQTVSRAAEARCYSAADFFESAGLWRSWEHHGSFSRPDLQTAVEHANSRLKAFRDRLQIAAATVLTPSSAVVYCLKTDGRIVANCHKVENRCFYRRLLSPAENRTFLVEAVERILEFNRKCRIILTLSPVRHYPGDLVLNARSKAALLTALHEVSEEFPENCVYFPAYEILQDELRDYRFYRPDLLHPSEPAAELICGRFVKTFFTAAALEIMEKKFGQTKLRRHWPLNNSK
ncbi:MAG: GSCFA domain-containing protein [Victivallaceae bacterium]|nr:GSCFA domain-containing protein [Victivallaceae bacterium]